MHCADQHEAPECIVPEDLRTAPIYTMMSLLVFVIIIYIYFYIILFMYIYYYIHAFIYEPVRLRTRGISPK